MKIKLGRIKALRPPERDLVRRVLIVLRRCQAPVARPWERELKAQVDRLDLLAKCLREAPSIYGQQAIGDRRRDVYSLIDALAHSRIYDFELHMPLRALVGRTLLMAKLNFFRLIRHILSDVARPTASSRNLAGDLERRLCNYIYTKIAEEILTRLACDEKLEGELRRKSVAMLCQIWEHRLTYQMSDFFPVLESVWEARRRAKVVFGTLLGTSELFELVRAGIDDRFIDLFSSAHITPDQRLAFEEFLFLTAGGELDRLREHIHQEQKSLDPNAAAKLLETSPQRFDLSSEAAEKMYESFRRRNLAALVRRSHGGAGPSRTAEEYIMIHLLEQTGMKDILADPNGDGK